MILSDLCSTALTALKRNRMRSILTTLGVIIGVGSVVLMVSVGASFEKYILVQLEGIGANTIDVYPHGVEKFGFAEDSLTFQDADAIARLTTVMNVAPTIFVAEPVKYGREERTPFIAGSYPGFYVNYGIEVERGRLISEQDNKAAKYVAVLGPDTVEDLFNEEDPIGKKVTIAGRKLTVIGVTKEMGSLTGQDIDKMVSMPFTTAKAITGQNYVSYITLQAREDTDLAIADIKSLLRQRHSIDNPNDEPDLDDFLARSAEQATEILGTVTTSITAFLSLVAGISLLVGGIGIMNIMLVSVSERTSEIGLRKAVGAKKRDILLQFLLEAVVLTMIGGVVGIIGGLTIAYLLAALANSFLGDFPFAISWPAVVLATLMALATGVVFGLYPAKKAANLSPMEAMRSE